MNVFKAMETHSIAFFIIQVVSKKWQTLFRSLRILTNFNGLRSFENERNAKKVCCFIPKE